MERKNIYPTDWLAIHPYTMAHAEDAYYVELSNRLYEACRTDVLLPDYRKKFCLYVAAYLEDKVSDLRLWKSFSEENEHLYGRKLPFYALGGDYRSGEVNEEDIRFLLWNTWQKTPGSHPYVNPFDKRIGEESARIYALIKEAHEEAPANPSLKGCMDSFADLQEAEYKLTWLFGHSYLTEPSMWPYMERVSADDRFIIPTGPLALFLHEWIDRMAPHADCWKSIRKLYPAERPIPDEVKERNQLTYQLFSEATGGNRIVYLDGYEALKRFLTDALHWPDDENHTLPQMKAFSNFILMAEPEKGILLAKDICAYIADKANPLYCKEVAARECFRLLTEPMLCPPDLLTYCITHRLLPDASLPGDEGNEWVVREADFIARHALLYYYRGD